MFKAAITQRIIKEYFLVRKYSNGTRKEMGDRFKATPFNLQRVLIISKQSRYEFELERHPHMKQCDLEAVIRDRGTDLQMLIYFHRLNKEFEQRVVKSFRNAGCIVKLANRSEYRTSLSKEIVQWADLIVPIGGDGTFLLAAGRASPLFAQSQHKTPIVGFNSDIKHSEGRLMLQKHYSEDTSAAVERIKRGDFNWMHRSRIRTSILTDNGQMLESTDLFRHQVTKMEQEKIEPEILSAEEAKRFGAKMKRVIPYLALNEIFIGENLSARVSLLQLLIDDDPQVKKTKCSGLCVSTGTGSTSWHNSINRITEDHVKDLLKILPSCDHLKDIDTEAITAQYNQNLLFAPDDPHMSYSIREQICARVWPSPNNLEQRKFVQKLCITSRCIEANLVIDGSISYPFNDGAKALLEIHPEDALLTIALD